MVKVFMNFTSFSISTMSLKLRDPAELFIHNANNNAIHKKNGEDEIDVNMETRNVGQVKKKRAPASLTITCPICSRPAPEHVHFGGIKRF